MTPAEDEQFSQFLRDAAGRAKHDLGYTPSYFLNALGNKGGYLTAVDLLVPGKAPSDGFIKLWEAHRLDLSVEALILESDWHRHFPDDVLQVARSRLQSVGYTAREVSVQGDPVPEPQQPAAPSPAPTQATAPTTSPSQNYTRAENVWKITGPPENFLTAIQRGHWALNERHQGAWGDIQPGDIVVFHSTRQSQYTADPPSAILGFARVGASKFRKTEHWWMSEIQDSKNHWPNAFAIEDVCLAPGDLTKLDLITPFEDKSDAQREREILAVLANAYLVSAIQEDARRLEPRVPQFPVNGSIARLSEVYRRAVLSYGAWVLVAGTRTADDLAAQLLTDDERAEIAAQTHQELLSAAQAYKDPDGPSHKERQARVRIENAKQKYRVACLEEFTCQVCGYQQDYMGKTGIQRWIIQVDHIVQKADLGGETINNLWVLCPTCHAEKTCGVLRIHPGSYAVTRLGKPIPIRNRHLPIETNVAQPREPEALPT